jgi:osmotically-inducible protein OsmY
VANSNARDGLSPDEQIILTAQMELSKYFWIPGQQVKLTSVDGWITLDGHLEWLFEKTTAEKVLSQIDGVRGVSNRITVDQYPGQVSLR